MGATPVQGTHDPRPTGKLFAAKWKHEHLRMVIISAILSFAVIVMFTSLLHDASAKSVTVVDGDKTATYKTRSDSVSGFLEEQGITIGPHDKISVPLAGALDKSERIVIERAKPIVIQADGTEIVKYTTQSTVGEALAALNIPLGSEDRIEPPAQTPLQENLRVKITRVRTEQIETQHPIAYKVVEKKDNQLESGKKKVVTTGKEGLLVKKLERVYEDGKLVREEVKEEVVVKPAVQQVVAVGTRKNAPSTLVAKADVVQGGLVKLNGKEVKVKKTLKNVTLTAYSAGPESTGKKPGDKGYGVTRSGTKVQEGRTIAVDPKVIPLGWWVYIEGIGLRRAEDTGGAVKGNKIDIYYESEKTAEKFGTKKGYTVHVIGPVKPTFD
jgi:uncharacterized protein YabE (DUF348 family)/3D (Asp-Asp-Asp) domain-containing protein